MTAAREQLSYVGEMMCKVNQYLLRPTSWANLLLLWWGRAAEDGDHLIIYRGILIRRLLSGSAAAT
jgi:hypothetical protein